MGQTPSSTGPATLRSYSLHRVLTVAVVLALAPLAGLVALSAPGLTAAFLVGLLAVGFLSSARGRRRRPESPLETLFRRTRHFAVARSR